MDFRCARLANSLVSLSLWYIEYKDDISRLEVPLKDKDPRDHVKPVRERTLSLRDKL